MVKSKKTSTYLFSGANHARNDTSGRRIPLFAWLTFLVTAVLTALLGSYHYLNSMTRFPSSVPSKSLPEEILEVLSWGTRVSGSESMGHQRFRRHVAEEIEILRQLVASSSLSNSWSWAFETHSFTQQTVIGNVTFHNLIATLGSSAPSLQQSAPRTLVVAAHYDSKLFPDFAFVGATDSVVSCVMLLAFARNITMSLISARSVSNLSSTQLKLVWVDGEEAFGEWSGVDSLYGSRQLAADWEAQGFLPEISLFLLLDLLGSSHPTFYCFPGQSRPSCTRLSSLERKLRRAHKLKTAAAVERFFVDRDAPGTVEDDHVPFMRRGVPVLQVIPLPFPTVWHTAEDSAEALHWDTILDVMAVLQAYLAQELKLP